MPPRRSTRSTLPDTERQRKPSVEPVSDKKPFFQSVKNFFIDERTHYVVGLILLGIAIYICFACISYFFTGMDDYNYIHSVQSLSEQSEEVKFNYHNWTGPLGARIADAMIDGGFGVAIFLILSGFGLMESYKKNGLENYFKKRLLRILTPYVLWVMIYTIIMYGLHFLIYLSDIRYWFVEYISLWYLVFFFVQKYFRRYRWSLFGITAIITFYFLPCLQAQQSLSFVIGLAISEYRQKLEQLDRKKLYQTAVILAHPDFSVAVPHRPA